MGKTDRSAPARERDAVAYRHARSTQGSMNPDQHTERHLWKTYFGIINEVR